MQQKTNSLSAPRSMRPFFMIWSAQAFSLLGSELVQFVLIWWLTIHTGSATVLAVASAMGLLPQVFIGPFAGALVDRWNRRIVMQVADSLVALATLLLIVLFGMGIIQPWHIYAVMFIRSIGGAFHWPAMQASTSLMVPKEHLARIAGLNQSLEGLGRIIMPPLGALLIKVLPIEKILFIDIATALLAITPLFFVKIPNIAKKESSPTKNSYLLDLKAGLRFVKSIPGLLILIVIGPLFSLLMFPALSFQPLLVTEHFKAGALELAGLQAAFGAGIVMGGCTLGAWGGLKRKTTTGFLALLLRGIGLGIVGFAPANGLWVGMTGLIIAGFMTPIVTGSLFAVMQTSVPPIMQGRVFTLMRSGFSSAPLIGLVIAGPLAEIWGVQPWFIIAGIAMLLIGAAGFFLEEIRIFEDHTYEVNKDGEAITIQ